MSRYKNQKGDETPGQLYSLKIKGKDTSSHLTRHNDKYEMTFQTSRDTKKVTCQRKSNM